MSLYGDYIKEREDKEIIEDERGFATYKFLSTYCYIVDIYVAPKYRKQNVASEYADKITAIAKEKDFHTLLGSVCPTTNNATDSIKVLIAYGFQIANIEGESDLIYFTKEIE